MFIYAKRPLSNLKGLFQLIWQRPTFPRSYPRSIIGPEGLNFRVRDGNGCDPLGIATRTVVEFPPVRIAIAYEECFGEVL